MNWQVVSYNVGLAVLVVLMVVALVTAYRVWVEIHDVEEPDSPADLLASFEQAHAAGALDDEEFRRVRWQLAGDSLPQGQPQAETSVRDARGVEAGGVSPAEATDGDRDAR
jgi:hypothetical protein